MAAVVQSADLRAAWGELHEFSWRPVCIRWWVALGFLAAVLGVQAAGAVFSAWPFVLAVLFLLAGNVVIYRTFPRPKDLLSRSARELHQLVSWQAAVDGIALWAVTYLSGGVTSPLAVGFLLPVFFASVLLPARTAYAFCGIVLAALGLTALAELWGWLPHQAIIFHGAELVPASHPARALAFLGVLGAVAFGTAALARSVTCTFCRQVQDLDRLRETEAVFSRRLQSVFSILETIGSVRDLHRVLETAVAEVAGVMQVKGASVKLLSEDGKFLRYEAAFGLPDAMIQEKLVEVERSPAQQAHHRRRTLRHRPGHHP